MGRCQRRASASICWWWSRRKEQSDDNDRDWANHFVPAHHRHHSLWQYWRVFHWFNHPRWMLGGCKIENRFRKFPPPSSPEELSSDNPSDKVGRKEVWSEREKRFAEQTNQLGQVIEANLSIKFIIYRYLQFTGDTQKRKRGGASFKGCSSTDNTFCQ